MKKAVTETRGGIVIFAGAVIALLMSGSANFLDNQKWTYAFATLAVIFLVAAVVAPRETTEE